MSDSSLSAVFFGIDVELYRVGVEIRVNDIPTYFDEESGQLKTEIPTPENIIDGINNLSVRLMKPYDREQKVDKFDENAYASVSLFEQKAAGSQKIVHLAFKVSLDEDGVFKMSGVKASDKIGDSESILLRDEGGLFSVKSKISSPFPKWEWLDGKNIEKNQANYQSLLSEYKRLHALLSNKDMNGLKSAYSARAREIAVAYGFTSQEDGHRKLSTGEDMLDANLELHEFFEDGMYFDVLANGKLARIVDADNMQPILYYDEKNSLVHFYKFMFYLDKSNKWIMIR